MVFGVVVFTLLLFAFTVFGSKQPIVDGRIGRFDVDLVNQLLTRRAQRRRRRQFPATPLLQQQRFHIGRVVSLQPIGLGDRRQHVVAAVHTGQIEQPPQMMAGLHRALLQLQMKLTGHVAQSVECFFQMMSPISLAYPQRLQLMLGITDHFPLAIRPAMAGHVAAFVKNSHQVGIAAHHDRLADHFHRRGILVAVELYAGVVADHRDHDFIGVRRQAGKPAQMLAFPFEAIDRTVAWCRRTLATLSRQRTASCW